MNQPATAESRPEPHGHEDVTHFSLSGRDIIKRLGQSGFSSIASRLRGVVAMPLALLLLGTSGYGTLTASFALGSILGSFSTLGLPDAVGRLVVSCRNPTTALRMVHAVRTTSIRTLLVLAAATAIYVAAGAGEVVLWGGLIGVTTALFKVGAVHLEYFQQTARLLRLSLINNYGSLVLAAVGGLALGFTGFLGGTVLGTALAALVAWRTLSIGPEVRSAQLPSGFWKSGLKLTALLLPVTASQWAIVSLASLVIYSRLGSGPAGAYSTAYSISSVGSLLVAAIAGVWAQTAQRMIVEDRKRTVRVGLRLMGSTLAIGGIATVAAAIAAPYAEELVAHGPLAGAPACVPWLIASFTLLAAAQVPSGLIYVLDQTRLLTAGTLVAGASFTIALLGWIDNQGILGASRATLLGYAILFALMIVAANFALRRTNPGEGQTS